MRIVAPTIAAAVTAAALTLTPLAAGSAAAATGSATGPGIGANVGGSADAGRWMVRIIADGQHSLYGYTRIRHPRYTERQVANEATATRNRWYPGRSVHRVFVNGTRVTLYF